MASCIRIESGADFAWTLDIAEMARETGDYGKRCIRGCYWLMADGGKIGFRSARSNRQLILSTLVDADDPAPEDLQWLPIAMERNDDEPFPCDDNGDTIEVHPKHEG